MNDSNQRFDPYTGEPIPENANDMNNQSMDSNATNFTPDNTEMQPETNTINLHKEGQESVVDTNQPYQEQPAFNHEQPANNNYSESNVSSQGYQEYPNQNNDIPYTAGSDNMYHTTDSRYIPNNNPNTVNDFDNNVTNQQYNPYTGQPLQATQQPADTEKKDQNANIFSAVALGCGIASIVCSFATLCCCPFLSIILSVVGIILGCLAKDSMNRRNGLAVAGIITSICGILLTILLCFIFFGIARSSDSFYDKIMKESGIYQDKEDYNEYDNYEYDTNGFDMNSYYNYDNDIYDNDSFY